MTKIVKLYGKENQEYLHIQYIKEKLAEAEVIASNPNEWSNVDELFKEWDSWKAVK